MRFLMVTAALAFTASPVLGQFRSEIPQWAEQGNASDQTRLGLMYDLDWDVRRDDTEDVRWKPILMGAGIGAALGFAFGWWIDEARGDEAVCIRPVSDPNGLCMNQDSSYDFRIAMSLHGLWTGGLVGWIWALIEAGAD